MKLSSVAIDTLGKSGRAILEAMIDGEKNPKVLSELVKGRIKTKMPVDGQRSKFSLKSGLIWLNFRQPPICVHGQDWLQGTTSVRGNKNRGKRVKGTKSSEQLL